MLSPAFFINLFYLVLFCIYVCVDDVKKKYIMFEPKKYGGVIFNETEDGYKNWRVINLSFQNWHKEFDKF